MTASIHSIEPAVAQCPALDDNVSRDRRRAPARAWAGREQGPNGEALCVRDAEGALLFEYFPERGCSVVHVPKGDLRIAADQGSIELTARDSVRVQAGGDVHLGVGDDAREPTTRLSLMERAALLASPLVEARAREANLQTDRARLGARLVEQTVAHSRRALGLLETEVGRVLERAGETYREVEGLSQTHAGRVRVVAKKTLHLLGERAHFKADKDMKLRGEKIYLA